MSVCFLFMDVVLAIQPPFRKCTSTDSRGTSRSEHNFDYKTEVGKIFDRR